MKKGYLLSFVLLTIVAAHAFPVYAQEAGLTYVASCEFQSGAGLLDAVNPAQVFKASSKECNGVLLANYIQALNIFLYRLAIGLAVLMITIGGFQWLVAVGNQSKIAQAKDTILQAIFGLVLALTAVLLFRQIDMRFVSISLNPNIIDPKKICNHATEAELVKVKSDFPQFTLEKQTELAYGRAEQACGADPMGCHWENKTPPTSNVKSGECVPGRSNLSCSNPSLVSLSGLVETNGRTGTSVDIAMKDPLLQLIEQSKNKGYMLTLTEACPVTVVHKDVDHGTGCAVDMSVKTTGDVCAAIIDMSNNIAPKLYLHILNEYGRTCATKGGITTDTCNNAPGGCGEHIHIDYLPHNEQGTYKIVRCPLSSSDSSIQK